MGSRPARSKLRATIYGLASSTCSVVTGRRRSSSNSSALPGPMCGCEPTTSAIRARWSLQHSADRVALTVKRSNPWPAWSDKIAAIGRKVEDLARDEKLLALLAVECASWTARLALASIEHECLDKRTVVFVGERDPHRLGTLSKPYRRHRHVPARTWRTKNGIDPPEVDELHAVERVAPWVRVVLVAHFAEPTGGWQSSHVTITPCDSARIGIVWPPTVSRSREIDPSPNIPHDGSPSPSSNIT